MVPAQPTAMTVEVTGLVAYNTVVAFTLPKQNLAHALQHKHILGDRHAVGWCPHHALAKHKEAMKQTQANEHEHAGYLDLAKSVLKCPTDFKLSPVAKVRSRTAAQTH